MPEQLRTGTSSNDPEAIRTLFVDEFKKLVNNHVEILGAHEEEGPYGLDVYKPPTGLLPVIGAVELGYMTDPGDDEAEESGFSRYKFALHANKEVLAFYMEPEYEVVYQEHADGDSYIGHNNSLLEKTDHVSAIKLARTISLFRAVNTAIETGSLVNKTEEW